MQENVSSARRTNAEERADDTGSRHRGFEDIGFKPLVEEIGGAHGHELHEGVTLVGRKFAKTLEQKMKLLEIFGLSVVGSGGIIESMGFTKRHMGVIILENSS